MAEQLEERRFWKVMEEIDAIIATFVPGPLPTLKQLLDMRTQEVVDRMRAGAEEQLRKLREKTEGNGSD